MAAYKYSQFFSPENPSGIDEDFIQNPELWRDNLPQPYRMIDETLQELLICVFEETERRKTSKEKQRLVKRVPTVRDATLMMSLPECNLLAVADGVDYIVGCGPMGVYVAKMNGETRSDDEDGVDSTGDRLSMAQISCNGITKFLGVGSRGGAVYIAVVINYEVIKILVYKDQRIFNVCKIDVTTDQNEGTSKTVASLFLSPSVTHLSILIKTITSTNNENGETPVVTITSSTVALYSLPIDQWSQQLLSMDSNQQDGLFSGNPSLVYTLIPPLTTPSPANDPGQILKLVQDKSSVTIAVDNIALTDTYLKARKELFALHPVRRDFMPTDSAQNQHSFESCLLEYLFYWDGIHSTQSPIAIAVAWKNTFQLLIFLTNKKTNVSVTPDRVYLQASFITSMAANEEYICLGLISGSISLIDLKRGLSRGVQMLSLHSEVSIVRFAPVVINADATLPWQPVTIIGGCVDGSVHRVQWKSLDGSTHNILSSEYGHQCNSAVHDIVFCRSVPTFMATKHDDGGIIMWEWSRECRPLCILSLPPSFNHTLCNGCHVHHSLTAAVDSIFGVSTKPSDGSTDELCNGVFHWNLSTCEVLRKTWITSSVSSTDHASKQKEVDQINILMDMAEQYNRISDSDNEEMERIIAKCWEELEGIIMKQKTTS